MEVSMSAKTRLGNYFEDFRLGQEIVHATPRTVTDGDIALYTALFGSRFAVTSSAPFAAALGLECAPIDSLLAFPVVWSAGLSRRHAFDYVGRKRIAWIDRLTKRPERPAGCRWVHTPGPEQRRTGQRR